MAADPLSRVFSALADPTRRDIVARLAVGDATDVLAHLVWTGGGRYVRDVWVGGDAVVRDRVPTRVDVDALRADVAARAARLAAG